MMEKHGLINYEAILFTNIILLIEIILDPKASLSNYALGINTINFKLSDAVQ